VTVTVAPTASRVEVAVEDEGAGIADDERERMFQRFVRGAAAGSAGGAGLGLAIARALARAMNGDLTVAGARFVVTLPAA
jgi:signal transduction histidine kinase